MAMMHGEMLELLQHQRKQAFVKLLKMLWNTENKRGFINMSKVFGYPEYDENNVMQITEYEGDYSEMMMDIFVKKLNAGEEFEICREGEEVAALLLGGDIDFFYTSKPGADFEGPFSAKRKDVFEKASWAVHVCTGRTIKIVAKAESEVLIQATHNDKEFESKFYVPEDSPWNNGYPGKFGDVANR